MIFFLKSRIQKKNNNVQVHFLRAKVKWLSYRKFYIIMALIQMGAEGSVWFCQIWLKYEARTKMECQQKRHTNLNENLFLKYFHPFIQ